MEDKTKNKVTNTEKQAIDDPLLTLLTLSGEGGIERTEAQGQRELVNSEILPIRLNGGKKKEYEQIGIVFGDPVEGDPLFQNATLPKGWKKERTNHSLWSKVVDDKGRERINIFYKAACYDRAAHMNLVRRFSTDSYKHDNKTVVLDGGTKELFEHEHNGEYDSREIARNCCEQWLSNKYPNWKNVTAYWND